MKILLAPFSLLVPVTALGAQETPPALTHGPFLGHVDATTLHVWARAAAPGTWTLRLRNQALAGEHTTTAEATVANDQTLHFVVGGLAADTVWRPELACGATLIPVAVPWSTASADDAAAASIAFGSCANDKTVPEQPIWARIRNRAPHALVLLGDTPYIDLVTTPARRQRHREFFAFPEVAATLSCIPTWTTWDDHDYTVNDQFGPVKGSESARGVFVEYHAHAGYGDGTRGIWTRFRRGPVEVFLLDTRSFADSEPSVLAPGERSVLGKAQTGWLQPGLRASTAPCKVLACGMVWNGGVRPTKKDCWGNWLPERDALFRWLGQNHIDGVVLVSGDVHRSRLILHPTRELVGYDVPEAVTSPLAQSVIEANKVDVPGLEFDAGEASSCLILEAKVGDGGEAVVRLSFHAGDGREFHVREFTAGSLQQPDAAPHYRRLQLRLREAFGARLDGLPARDEPTPAAWRRAAESPAWRQAVQKATPAFAVWRQAITEPTFRQRPARSDFGSEFRDDLCMGCVEMHALVDARGRQGLADGDPAAAVAAIDELLGHARQLRQLRDTNAWLVAAVVETRAVDLAAALAQQAGPAAAVPATGSMARHLAARPALVALVVLMREENHADFRTALAQLAGGKDRKAMLARTFTDDVQRHYERNLAPLFAPAERLGSELTAVDRDALAQAKADLVARMKQRQAAIAELARDAAADVGADAAADLGLMLATLVLPPLAGALESHDAARAALTAAVAK